MYLKNVHLYIDIQLNECEFRFLFSDKIRLAHILIHADFEFSIQSAGLFLYSNLKLKKKLAYVLFHSLYGKSYQGGLL
jgi:hypothetical protein